jgi:hypothetical protein
MDQVMMESPGGTAAGTGAPRPSLAEPAVTLMVSTDGSGGAFRSISLALASHPASTEVLRIVVNAGTYDEVGLELRDNLQIVAAPGCDLGSETAVVITSRQDRPVVSSSAIGAVIRGLQIEHRGPFGSMACVVIEGGDLRMEDCIVTGTVSVGVLICGESTPTIADCQLLRCCGDGIKVVENAEPLVCGCDLHSNDGHKIIRTLRIASLYRKYTGALTVENFWQRIGILCMLSLV